MASVVKSHLWYGAGTHLYGDHMYALHSYGDHPYLQLHTGQIGLNKHLHCIKCTDSPACPSCNTTPQETVQHFLFECNSYCQECFELQGKLGCNTSKLSYLLTDSSAIAPTLKYVHSMHHLNQIFGKISS